MITSIDLSQEIFAIDVLTALKSFQEHRRQTYAAIVKTIDHYLISLQHSNKALGENGGLPRISIDNSPVLNLVRS